MPPVEVVALFSEAGPGHEESCPSATPTPPPSPARKPSPSSTPTSIRVIEDVVDVLIDRGLLRLTDLPPEAQRKLLARKGARARLRQGLDLLGPSDVI